MPIWTDEYLQLLQQRAEIELTTDVKCIFHRFSLAVTSGVSTYDLPEGIVSVQRVTWNGTRVNPYDQITAQRFDLHIDPLTETTSGKPYLYLQHNYGWDKIHFWPVPDENITADDSGIWGADIENRVVISCWIVADPTGFTQRLPEVVRRRVVKQYVNWKAYMKEGASQDIDAAGYFRSKYEAGKLHIQEVMGNIPRAIMTQMQPTLQGNPQVARPKLPSNFGRIVE